MTQNIVALLSQGLSLYQTLRLGLCSPVLHTWNRRIYHRPHRPFGQGCSQNGEAEVQLAFRQDGPCKAMHWREAEETLELLFTYRFYLKEKKRKVWCLDWYIYSMFIQWKHKAYLYLCCIYVFQCLKVFDWGVWSKWSEPVGQILWTQPVCMCLYSLICPPSYFEANLRSHGISLYIYLFKNKRFL